jgi:hypothetical protein
MNARLPLALLVAILTACPEPSVGDAGSDSTAASASEATTALDLPAETGDGNSGSETLGIDPGDGDDDGSTAEPTSLIVESNGERIGYLMGVWDYGFIVWDDEHEFTFRVSQQTGNVASDVFAQGDSYWYFDGPNCTGGRYVPSPHGNFASCDLVAPSRRHIIVDGGSTSGTVAPDSVWHSTQAPALVPYQSIQDMASLQCYANDSGTVCGMLIASTGAIPETFELPITVTESVALP